MGESAWRNAFLFNFVGFQSRNIGKKGRNRKLLYTNRVHVLWRRLKIRLLDLDLPKGKGPRWFPSILFPFRRINNFQAIHSFKFALGNPLKSCSGKN